MVPSTSKTKMQREVVEVTRKLVTSQKTKKQRYEFEFTKLCVWGKKDHNYPYQVSDDVMHFWQYNTTPLWL